MTAVVTPPPDLYGRPRADRLLRALVPVVAAYRCVSERSARRWPTVRAVDRDLRLVVRSVAAEADGVVSLTPADPSGAPLPAWSPGSHVGVVLPSGRVRQCSLCGDPADSRTYRVTVRLAPGGAGGSAEAHRLTAGSALVLRGPRNAFPFVGEGPWLFIAGGIGITPVLPMVRHAAARGADWRLVYTGRSRDSPPFLGELGSSDRGPRR